MANEQVHLQDIKNSYLQEQNSYNINVDGTLVSSQMGHEGTHDHDNMVVNNNNNNNSNIDSGTASGQVEPGYDNGSIDPNSMEAEADVLEGFVEDVNHEFAQILTEPSDIPQVFDIDGNQVEVQPGYVLTGTDHGVFMLEHGSRFGMNAQGKLITISPNGTPSELGP